MMPAHPEPVEGDWHTEDATWRAAIERWQLRAEAALVTLAMAWFGVPALAAWIEGAAP